MDGVARVGGTLGHVGYGSTCLFTRRNRGGDCPAISVSILLSDIYATISFYLQNKYAVDAYLEQRAKKAKAVRDANEKRSDQSGIRERLLARKAK